MASKRGDLPRDEMLNEDGGEDGAEARRAKLIKAGIGIGSAALVAALLYANHARKKKVDAAED
jgi:F0F1-type ATP synthase membrane subunit c/vacuolar-type H+-ATPase subunit K